MSSYSLSQLVGKTFYAKKDVPLFTTTGSLRPYAVVKPGNYIGVLHSWIQKNNELFFLFKYGTNNQFVIKYEPNAIDTKNWKSEGALTIEEEKKALDQKQLLDGGITGKIEYFIKKYGLYLIGAILAGQAIKGHLQRK